MFNYIVLNILIFSVYSNAYYIKLNTVDVNNVVELTVNNKSFSFNNRNQSLFQ